MRKKERKLRRNVRGLIACRDYKIQSLLEMEGQQNVDEIRKIER